MTLSPEGCSLGRQTGAGGGALGPLEMQRSTLKVAVTPAFVLGDQSQHVLVCVHGEGGEETVYTLSCVHREQSLEEWHSLLSFAYFKASSSYCAVLQL